MAVERQDVGPLTPEQTSFMDFANREEEMFKVYGVDTQRLFMVSGTKPERGSRQVWRRYYEPADSNDEYSFFPFHIMEDVVISEDEENGARLVRIIKETENGPVYAFFGPPGEPNISVELGEERVGLTYVG